LANTATSTVIFVDTGSEALNAVPTRLVGIILTATEAQQSSELILQENSTAKETKIHLITYTPSLHIDLKDTPILFTNGIYVDTMDDGVATLIVERA
jgi:hypothetical protein